MQIRRTIVCALAALAALHVGAPAALANCGGAHQVDPNRGTWHPSRRPALVVGDSTMLFALDTLGTRGLRGNARGCRQISELHDMLARLRASKRLPPVLVVALGANGPVTISDLRSVLRVLGPKRRLVLVTPRNNRWGTRNAMFQIKRDRPRLVTVLDWRRFTARKSHWFAADGLHIAYPYAIHYTNFIANGMFKIALDVTGLVQTPNGPRPAPPAPAPAPVPVTPAPA